MNDEEIDDFLMMLWLLVMSSGGKIRIPHNLIASYKAENAHLARYRDNSTGEEVITAFYVDE